MSESKEPTEAGNAALVAAGVTVAFLLVVGWFKLCDLMLKWWDGWGLLLWTTGTVFAIAFGVSLSVIRQNKRDTARAAAIARQDTEGLSKGNR